MTRSLADQLWPCRFISLLPFGTGQTLFTVFACSHPHNQGRHKGTHLDPLHLVVPQLGCSEKPKNPPDKPVGFRSCRMYVGDLGDLGAIHTFIDSRTWVLLDLMANMNWLEIIVRRKAAGCYWQDGIKLWTNCASVRLCVLGGLARPQGVTV